MATRDGVEIPQCQRCTSFKDDVRAYDVEKSNGAQRRLLCEACRAITAETYKVSKTSGKSAADAPESPSVPAATRPAFTTSATKKE